MAQCKDQLASVRYPTVNISPLSPPFLPPAFALGFTPHQEKNDAPMALGKEKWLWRRHSSTRRNLWSQLRLCQEVGGAQPLITASPLSLVARHFHTFLLNGCLQAVKGNTATIKHNKKT